MTPRFFWCRYCVRVFASAKARMEHEMQDHRKAR